MRIAVTTPTGNIGRRLVHNLQEQGAHDLVLLARDPAKLAAEQSRGAAVVQGDLTDEAFVTEATVGADALFVVCPPAYHVDDMRAFYNTVGGNVAAAVEANGIGHTVLVSSVGAHLPHGTGPVAGLYDAEKILSEATQALTILRPSFFMENYLFHVDSIKAADSIFMPVSGSIAFPMIATSDIGDRATDVIVGPAPTSPAIVPLHGPSQVSLDEAARFIGEHSGRAVHHVQVEPAQAREALVAMGMTEGAADTMLEMYAAFEQGTVIDETPPGPEANTQTTFEAFVDGVLGPAVGG